MEETDALEYSAGSCEPEPNGNLLCFLCDDSGSDVIYCIFRNELRMFHKLCYRYLTY